MLKKLLIIGGALVLLYTGYSYFSIFYASRVL